MAFFTNRQKLKLARSLITKTSPAYVQFYITARCNLACEHCNIIYADADCQEMNISQIRAVAENLAQIGVCIVLLIGGEPFVRKDLPEIIEAFTQNDIHVRMQTNGLASENMLERCIKAGGHDISISLDSLNSAIQDIINGNYQNSWKRAIKTVSMINMMFPENGTGFFGTVLMPRNMEHIVDVLEFATAIGWGVSLVPVHTTTPDNPLGFRTLENASVCKFPGSSHCRLREILNDLKRLRKQGMNLYDSDEYLDDIYRFIVGQPVQWRRRNQDVCDSPSLYFAIDPSGNIKPCCDYKLSTAFPVYHPDFPKWYFEGIIHQEVYAYTRYCPGCMYGSYPEITITARYFKPLVERFWLFNTQTHNRLKKMKDVEMLELATEIFQRNERYRQKRQATPSCSAHTISEDSEYIEKR